MNTRTGWKQICCSVTVLELSKLSIRK